MSEVKGVLRDHRQKLREEAVARQEARAERTDQDQLQKLTDEGHGHCHEAQWLKAKIKTEEV